MTKIRILWADDEITLLKPHIIFLEAKNYDVVAVTSGGEALDLIEEERFDIVFLDGNMPGLSGLETLTKIKLISPSLPVIMITKSEEESIMEEAIGAKISDYLIKPVNPNQILLTIKKHLDTARIVSDRTTIGYQQDFRNIGMSLHNNMDYEDWEEVYKKLIYWELELEKSEDNGMSEILNTQKEEANNLFARFVEENYLDWLSNSEEAPPMSHNVFRDKVFPLIQKDDTTFLIVIDNLRLDQWQLLKPQIEEYFWVDKEETYMSILPTTTQYARNALFAGLLPADIEKMYPKLWLNDEDEGGKNMHEPELIANQLKRLGKDTRFSYNKVLNPNYGRKVVGDIPNQMNNAFNVIVYNFIDMLSHARTDTDIIKELAEDESAYRSLTLSWFEHSPLKEALKEIANRGGKVVITTDHGSIKVKEPSKVVGDKTVNTNLRYKQGKNLTYESDDVLAITKPEMARLPKVNVSQTFIFAKGATFFAYPNNFNHYVNYYKNTFQHGGISMEEMMIPIIQLSPKK
ncbi:MAG: bifunctional response regulator/alkaline phosphatase family protein [Flavobacteriales bacterium]|nr:bifunctional response regulator/alkaline phosphatase family protein [Flavobacteriales bacterium]